MSENRFILASESPRRSHILNELGASFEIKPSDMEEIHDGDPEAMVRANAELKANFIAEKYPDRFVLGADTTVHIEGRILNKPIDMAEARDMLKKLADRTHAVHTGFSLQCLEQGVKETLSVRSEVTFKRLSDADIDHYFSIVNPLDKAGAYGIQEGTDIIIKSYSGSRSNIMGLPRDAVSELLQKYDLL